MKINPWPVVITFVCVAAFALAASVVVVMVSKKVELVDPDYYAQDQRHGERMNEERRAQSLAQPVVISYEQSSSSIDVAFPSKDISGTITLYRPSDLSMDQSIPISVDDENRQRIPAAELAAGLWRVQVQWRQNGQDFYHEGTVTAL